MSSPEREVRHDDGRIEHPDAPYEAKDIYTGCIFALLIATACVFVAMFILDWYFFRGEQNRQAETKASPYRLPPRTTSPLPPTPPLEGAYELIDRTEGKPGETYSERFAEMERQLHASGSTNEKGYVHIPIEQAMKEIVKQLPVRESSPDEAKPVHAGSSNSGRMLPGEPPWSDY